MSVLDKDKQYDQFNQRSRWYSSQLWYVPFAFVGIIALGIDKIPDVENPLKSIAFLMLSFFSLATFVHVTALKYYERRTVRAMQILETPVVSGGGSAWYMSFVLYIKIMLAIGVIGFFWVGSTQLPSWARVVLVIILIVVLVAVWISDKCRNDVLVREIRSAMDNKHADDESDCNTEQTH